MNLPHVSNPVYIRKSGQKESIRAYAKISLGKNDLYLIRRYGGGALPISPDDNVHWIDPAIKDLTRQEYSDYYFWTLGRGYEKSIAKNYQNNEQALSLLESE